LLVDAGVEDTGIGTDVETVVAAAVGTRTGTGTGTGTGAGVGLGICAEAIVGGGVVVEVGIGVGVGVGVSAIAGVRVGVCVVVVGTEIGAGIGVGATVEAGGRLVLAGEMVPVRLTFALVFNTAPFVGIDAVDVGVKGGETVLEGEPPVGGLLESSFFDTKPVGVDLLFFCPLRAGKCLS